MISVVIPTLNEEKAISLLVAAIAKALAGRDWRVVHVDDGSTDSTVSQVEQLRCQGLPIRTVSHPTNLGIGATFRDGIAAASENATDDDVIVFIEGDLTNDPGLLGKMVDRVREGHDVVIASRYRKGSAQPGFPFKRKAMSWVLNRLILRWWVGLDGVRDYSIFYRAVSARVLRRAMRQFGDSLITCAGFGANAELLCKLGRVGARCTEIPQVYDYRRCEGHSSIPITRTIVEYVRLLRAVRH